jgi:hypothetical protein
MATPENQARTQAGLTAYEPFVPARGRALFVVVLFAAYVVVKLFSAATTVIGLLTDPLVIAAAEGADEPVTLQDLLLLLGWLGAFLIYVALAVAFLVWLHRVSKNVPALGNPKSGVEHSPGWAVGSFFVPFVNLVVPYRAVREVWVKSDPAVRTGDDFMFAQPSSAPLLLGWWVMWIASNVLSNVFWQLHGDAETPGAQGFMAGLKLLSDLVSIVAAVLAVMVVRGIDRRQAERARHVTYGPNLPPPPPVFSQPPASAPGGAYTSPNASQG